MSCENHLRILLLLIWLPSNLGAILPRFELKVLLLICDFKIIRITLKVEPNATCYVDL